MESKSDNSAAPDKIKNTGEETENNEDTISNKDSDPASNSSENTSGDLTLNVSIDEIINNMPTEFSVKPDEDFEGQPSHVAMSKSGLARYDFIGDKNNLSEIVLMTSFNIKGNEDASFENTLIATKLLELTTDEETMDWFVNTVEKSVNIIADGLQKLTGDERIVGDKKITVIVDEFGIFYVYISHKDKKL